MKAVVVGAGLAGLTSAALLRDAGWDVEVFEQSERIGGHCADEHRDGFLVQLFGAHILHTDDDEVWSFVQRHTPIRPYRHVVVANTDRGTIPVPFNAISEAMLGPCTDGEIVDLIFRNYTRKMWGVDWEELPSEVRSRVRLRRPGTDCSYFADRYQGLPWNGYTAWMEAMTEGVRVHLGCEPDAYRKTPAHLTVYTGKLDEFYGEDLGPLGYRALRWVTNPEPGLPVAVVNECTEDPGLRIYDNGHWTKRVSHSLVTREYPAPYMNGALPSYPMPFGPDVELAAKYREREIHKVIFVGRLAEYRYLDMDDTIRHAIDAVRSVTE